MTILEGDIKLLKSAVMADTSNGGGAMTGVAVIDGQSNNLFPDTSEVDRSLGRVNLRKVFGVAHTSSTDTLLGAHAIITEAPADPLVHCTLLKTDGWSDQRDTARTAIEKYMVKGPRLWVRLLDTHYAGSLTVRLYGIGAMTDFPIGGDALVLRNPNGTEQYVRVLKTSSVSGQYTVDADVFFATIVTCELGQALAYDFIGPPMVKIIDQTVWASVYSTTLAAGARFYGIKPLAVDGAIGDIAATVAGGIYTPLVPAATIETPIIDQYPMQGRSAVVPTGYASLTVSNSMAIAAGSTIRLPSAITPASLAISSGSTSFTDSGTGILKQGTTEVATIDYRLGTIAFESSAPSYGTNTVTALYRPATAGPASNFSAELVITTANQGLAFVSAFEPPPAPGSFTLSYMAQGRWYTLADNAGGKLVGADSGYGVGTLNYQSGSMAVTLGAMPDVHSSLIADWGDAHSATAVSGDLPSRLSAVLQIPSNTKLAGVVVTWSRGGTNYSATTNAAGILSGDATGRITIATSQAPDAQFTVTGLLEIAPAVFPTGAFTVARSYYSAAVSTMSETSSHVFHADGDLPVRSGSVSGICNISSIHPFSNSWSMAATFTDDGNGKLTGRILGGQSAEFGTVDYSTGVVIFYETILTTLWVGLSATSGAPWQTGMGYGTLVKQSSSISVTGAQALTYYKSVELADTLTLNPSTWQLQLPNGGLETLQTSSAVFTLGGELYTSASGVIRKGWSLLTGLPTVGSAGSFSSGGQIQVTALPANGSNAIAWYNLAQDASAKVIDRGVFRTASAPLKTGVFQLQQGADVSNGSDTGALSGGGFSGSIDYQRGIVRWSKGGPVLIDPQTLAYNAVLLQYLPLDASLLGLETARLPLDGKVPIFRAGGIVVVHNTQSLELPNPLVKGSVIDLGRVRIAAVKVKTADGLTVDSTVYTTDLDAGTLTFASSSNLSGLLQPFTVEHRIEDMQLCSVADISGKLTFTRSLTHNYPASSSYASSALVVGDVFARAYNSFEQATWTAAWSDSPIGATILANFNETANPLIVTNKGAITERWAIIFTNTTAFRVVGESVGEIATGNVASDCSPLNPATATPYFTIPALGWGAGWATGNVYRFNTAACGAPLWVVRTVLQGPASFQDDRFTLAFRGDVDRP